MDTELDTLRLPFWLASPGKAVVLATEQEFTAAVTEAEIPTEAPPTAGGTPMDAPLIRNLTPGMVVELKGKKYLYLSVISPVPGVTCGALNILSPERHRAVCRSLGMDPADPRSTEPNMLVQRVCTTVGGTPFTVLYDIYTAWYLNSLNNGKFGLVMHRKRADHIVGVSVGPFPDPMPPQASEVVAIALRNVELAFGHPTDTRGMDAKEAEEQAARAAAALATCWRSWAAGLREIAKQRAFAHSSISKTVDAMDEEANTKAEKSAVSAGAGPKKRRRRRR